MTKQRYLSLSDYFTQTGDTHQSLADQVGCTRQFITLLANGTRKADLPVARKIEKLIGVPAQTLVRPEIAEALR